MIKHIVFLLLLLTGLYYNSHSQINSDNILKDGLYLIHNTGNDTTQFKITSSTEVVIKLNPLFNENNEEEFTRFLIDTADYVPLELEKTPETEQQTENKKKLMLSLTKEASEKLKTFTAKHVMEMVALVIDGQVATQHKIKEAITSGQLQITRCNDNACELLYIQLKDNVVKLR